MRILASEIQVDNGQFEINSRDDNSSRTDNIFVLGTGNIDRHEQCKKINNSISLLSDAKSALY